MKNIALIVVLAVAVLGCDISKLTNSTKNDNANTAKPTPTTEPKPKPTDTPKAVSTPTASAFIDILKKSSGKYPYELKLLDMPDLSARLKKLLGGEFAVMKKYWNVESPVEIQSDIAMTGGCEAHNCGSNHYLLFVDLKNDDINVYHVEDSGTKHYYERGEIKLPKKFADEIGDNQ